MPFLLARLILLALLFVAIFVTLLIGSMVVAQLMEHGRRHRRNQEMQGLTTLQALKLSLTQHRIAVACATMLVVGAFLWFPKGAAMPPAPPATVVATAAAVSAAKPGASTPLDKPTQELTLAQDAVHAWAAAWAARNLDEYLAAYSADFVPADNLARKKWEQMRRQRIGGAEHIEVTILNLTTVPLGRDLVKAVFIQKYLNRGMSDLSLKTLVLKREDKSWKIQSEQATPLNGVP